MATHHRDHPATTTTNGVHLPHDLRRHDVVVIMVPLPLQGHLNQLLHLSHLISSAYPDIPVHYAAASTHIHQARLRLQGRENSSIHFHQLAAPPFPSPPPPVDGATNFPAHLQPAMEAAALHLRGPVAALLRSLSPTARHLSVIHDSLMSSAVQDLSSLPNARSFSFHSVSAIAALFFRGSLPSSELPSTLPGYDIPPRESVFTPEFLQLIETQHGFLKRSISGKLYNTCPALEAPFIDLLRKKEQKRVWAIGPFNPVVSEVPIPGPGRRRHRCLEWLDQQPARSVLHVSFGTTTRMAKEQIDELAFGLEKSGQRFVWVLRSPDRGDVFDKNKEEKAAPLSLPEGFEERVVERGMVLREEWAPQVEILGHPATGGFMSHCGWNSCVESLGMGVPIAAWPMHSDQPANAALVAHHLKVGVVVREWARRSETVRRHRVEQVVRTLMASEEGDEMRRRAAELSGALRESVAEGGASRMELDSFVAHISRPAVGSGLMA